MKVFAQETFTILQDVFIYLETLQDLHENFHERLSLKICQCVRGFN